MKEILFQAIDWAVEDCEACTKYLLKYELILTGVGMYRPYGELGSLLVKATCESCEEVVQFLCTVIHSFDKLCYTQGLIGSTCFILVFLPRPGELEWKKKLLYKIDEKIFQSDL